MFADGIQAYISVRDRKDGAWQYVIGRMSPFVFVDTALLAERLNQVEKLTDDRWGGGDTIIGSPRIGGSRTPLPELMAVVEECVLSRGTVRGK